MIELVDCDYKLNKKPLSTYTYDSFILLFSTDLYILSVIALLKYIIEIKAFRGIHRQKLIFKVYILLVKTSNSM